MAVLSVDDYVLHVPVERGIRADRRPFRIAVDAQPIGSAAGRARAVWDTTLAALLHELTRRWAEGISVDPYDGEVVLTVSPRSPYVEVRFDAPESEPDPMHLRSLAHLADGLRPAIRTEGPLSVYELDDMTAGMVGAGIGQFPLASAADPRRAHEALDRIRARYRPAAHAAAS